MASTNMNSFYLLGDDESDDVSILYERIQNKTFDEVPSSPTKSKKQYTIFVEKEMCLQYEDEAVHVNENENENKDTRKMYLKQGIRNEDGQRGYRNNGQNYYRERSGTGNYHQFQQASWPENHKGNGQLAEGNKFRDGERPRSGNWNNPIDRRSRNGGYSGQRRAAVEYRRIDNSNSESLKSGNGDRAPVSVTNANSEGDAGVTFDSSIGKEAGEEKTTEVVNGVEGVKVDDPKPEETPEERKKRKAAEQEKKEHEERQRKNAEDRAEEAKKMTLVEYEKLLKEKQASNLQKAELRRVVAADKDLENMKLVCKKQANDAILIVQKKQKGKASLEKQTSEEKHKKSGSFDKKDRKPVAVSVAQLFRPSSFRRSNNGGMGQAIDRGNHSGFGQRSPSENGQTSNNGAQRNDGNPEELFSKTDFPDLGSVALESEPGDPKPPANPSV